MDLRYGYMLIKFTKSVTDVLQLFLVWMTDISLLLSENPVVLRLSHCGKYQDCIFIRNTHKKTENIKSPTIDRLIVLFLHHVTGDKILFL